MDFFTFVVVAVFIYKIFSKKDKPPQRMPRRPEGYSEPRPAAPEARKAQAEPQRNRRGGIFENLERQLRESAERLEKELQGKPTSSPQKTAKPKQDRAAMEKPDYQGVEGAWGTEGRSDYGRYESTEGSSDYDTYRTTEGVGSEELLEQQRQQRQRVHKGTQQGPAEREAALVSPTQKPSVQTNDERIAGIFGVNRSPLVQGIIWSEVLNEPKGKRAMMRRVQ